MATEKIMDNKAVTEMDLKVVVMATAVLAVTVVMVVAVVTAVNVLVVAEMTMAALIQKVGIICLGKNAKPFLRQVNMLEVQTMRVSTVDEIMNPILLVLLLLLRWQMELTEAIITIVKPMR